MLVTEGKVFTVKSSLLFGNNKVALQREKEYVDVAFSECFTESKGHYAEACNMSLMFGMVKHLESLGLALCERASDKTNSRR